MFQTSTLLDKQPIQEMAFMLSMQSEGSIILFDRKPSMHHVLSFVADSSQIQRVLGVTWFTHLNEVSNMSYGNIIFLILICKK